MTKHWKYLFEIYLIVIQKISKKSLLLLYCCYYYFNIIVLFVSHRRKTAKIVLQRKKLMKRYKTTRNPEERDRDIAFAADSIQSSYIRQTFHSVHCFFSSLYFVISPHERHQMYCKAIEICAQLAHMEKKYWRRKSWKELAKKW